MTYKPTDAELDALRQADNGELNFVTLRQFRIIARAALAKWGQPAQAAEPFCWQWENTFNGGTGAVKKNPETLGINMSHPDYKWTALYTAPQPTHAQAASSAVLKAIREANMQLVRTGDDAFMLQPSPTPQADSQQAPVAAFEVADAIADSQYLAGVSAGWNAANADDPNAALQKLHESRAGYLKPLRAARAPAESVLEDAARLDWLDQNIFLREMDEWDKTHGGRGSDNMWVMFAPNGAQGSARKILDAARKQGAPT